MRWLLEGAPTKRINLWVGVALAVGVMLGVWGSRMLSAQDYLKRPHTSAADGTESSTGMGSASQESRFARVIGVPALLRIASGVFRARAKLGVVVISLESESHSTVAKRALKDGPSCGRVTCSEFSFS